MDDAASTPNVENVCRLCLSADEPRSSIFEGDDSSVPLSFKIQACLAIEVSSSDKLSTLICRLCIKNVNQWHSYRESCLKAQDKLHQWQMQQIGVQTGVTIKQEPIDLEFDTDHNVSITELHGTPEHQEIQNDGVMALKITNEQTIRLGKDAEKSLKSETLWRRRTRSFALSTSPSGLLQESEKYQTNSKPYCTVEVKEEPLAEDEYDSTLEIESVTGGDILPNPVAMNCTEKDRVMEADSTQRSTSVTFRTKRKAKRGPHTHLRNKQRFTKKCVYCQINLHSKYSYTKHMERFHSAVSDSEQRDNKMGLKNVLKQKQIFKKSPSASFQDQIRLNRNNPQDETVDSIPEESSATVGINSYRRDVDEEMIEDVEDEIDNMDKNSDTPLSQVQQNIIGQLKTYSCYSCKQVFPDRRTTLNHLRQHLPDLRPFTCVACLTQFPDRSIYKDHCYTSFECAMKIAIVEPKSGLEKHFTCNMCSKSVENRKELLHHLTSQHSDEQQANATPTSSNKMPAKISNRDGSSPSTGWSWAGLGLPAPYQNGDPVYNNPCNYCGMIYKHKRNLLEHRELCARLPVNARTSYACVHCGMTFLVFKKFSSHLATLHNTTDIICAKCRKSFDSATDFLTHHENHIRMDDPQGSGDNRRSSTSFESPLKDWNDFEAEVHANESRISRQKYSCALCGQEFPTRTELGEHRNLHLKVKIYSCVICRSMFSSAGALEVHMKDHGIEDPAEQSAHTSYIEYEGTEDTKDFNLTEGSRGSEADDEETTCKICQKRFSSLANLRRHTANVHRNSKRRRKCVECNKVFTKKNSYEYHVRMEHKGFSSPIKCSVCPQTFISRTNLNLHYETVHAHVAKAPYECDICGRQFKEDLSCKIHRGWHARRSRRLTEDLAAVNRNSTLMSSRSLENFDNPIELTQRPARARKSFPNSPPAKPAPQLQCQVCDNKFSDVTELRKHLWDVHCARNKSEKDYTTSDLQCELCTHILPDRPSLERHLEWHMENPILSDTKNGLQRKRYFSPTDLRTHPCDVCGNFYTSRKSLLRHKKLHKVSTAATVKFQSLAKKPSITQFPCNVCHKTFGSSMKLRKHKLRHFVNPAERKKRSVLEKSDFKCELCLKYYISEVGLRFHVEKTCPFREQETYSPRLKRRRIASTEENAPSAEVDPPKHLSVKSNVGLPVAWRTKKMVNCSICHKSFLGKSLFYKHRQIAHPKEITSRAEVLSVKKQSLAATAATDVTKNFRCNICGKTFPAALNLKLHRSAVHKHASLKNTCAICNLKFNSGVGLKNHMQKHSTDTFSCNICTRIFRSRPAVFIHLNRQHPEEYDLMQDNKSKLFTEIQGIPEQPLEPDVTVPFKCGLCNKTFETKKGLKVHSVKLHSVRHE
ncbi:zinc finger protein 62 homolog isoform X1 [Neodiprion virginianus]|uniref:zinc finger protein 62 homolog isoform X1 n=1 Tax=Neodiprion virginianus TaxID=2961670 RepID=UPI001EE6DE85|nr:zinc finger protein 62 homolog isoform X1 [Neodiprion virginianus]